MNETRDPAMEKLLRLMADMQQLEQDDALGRELAGKTVLFPQGGQTLEEEDLASVAGGGKPPPEEPPGK